MSDDSQFLKVDEATDTLSVYGVTYSLGLFRTFAVGPLGGVIRIVDRKNGIVTLQSIDLRSESIGAQPIPEVADGFEFAMRVEICSDTAEKVEACRRYLMDQILDASTEHDVMITMHGVGTGAKP